MTEILMAERTLQHDLLQAAIVTGDLAALSDLLATDPTLIHRCLPGGPPLHVAAISGQATVVRFLLSRGADPNMCCRYGQTALTVLVNHFVNFSPSEITSLITLLVDCGADVNARDYLHRTPLHLCRSAVAAEALINAGARVNLKDHDGLEAADYIRVLHTKPPGLLALLESSRLQKIP